MIIAKSGKKLFWQKKNTPLLRVSIHTSIFSFQYPPCKPLPMTLGGADAKYHQYICVY